jgi:hypothetical protein
MDNATAEPANKSHCFSFGDPEHILKSSGAD